MSESENYNKERKAARPTNIARVIVGFIFISISIIYELPIILIISIAHLIASISWLFMVERYFVVYNSRPILWYLISSFDIFTVTLMVYLTGDAYSSLTLAYIVMTTLSSVDLDRRKGVYSASVGCLSYSILVLLVYLKILPEINIVSGNKSEEITLFAVILSITFLCLACTATNLVIYTIYSQLNESNKNLSLTLEEVKSLKYQQDGDYFLTSLLIEPLVVNKVPDNKLKIEYYISQYKKFKFRQFEKELGGDIVLSDVIHLEGEEYVFFANGDAMGKSMQGAGGALVLGVLLKSLLSRIQLETSSLSPENWLLNTFNELHKMFLSFDGMMLVSAVLGVVHKENGKVYFINSEHPALILYRDHKAEFIKYDDYIPKIGTPTMDELNVVHSFLLRNGDCVFIGSDGKDDLVLVEEKDSRDINPDETLFLKIVETYRGDLQLIVQNLSLYGKLSDDISILKISFGDHISGGNFT
jgi:Stage II sporulation protein E (SpoIIE)